MSHKASLASSRDSRHDHAARSATLTIHTDPECYLLGKKRLQLEGEATDNIIVLEDAPAGIRAGKSAGCKVIGLATSHPVDLVKGAGADWVVKDLSSVEFAKSEVDSKMALRISNALVM